MNATDRRAALKEANRILKADNDNEPPKGTVRFRGGRPGWNWLARNNEHGAACLWMVARQRLPQAANDNRADAAGMGLDRRKDGKARGSDPAPRSLAAYLAMPGIRPRLGDSEQAPVVPAGFHGWYDLKPQRDVHEFHPDCRHGYCATTIADDAFFMGAVSGLGQPRPHTRRGDIRRVDEPEMPSPPAEIDTVIEAILARADLAGIGRALGCTDSRPDRVGKRALLDAARWAVGALASKSRHVTP